MTELPEIDLDFEAKRNIETIAGRWFDLKARLHPTSSGTKVGSRTAPTSRPPIDLHVSDLLAEIERWARFHVQVLMDETDYTPQHGITVRGMLLDVAERYGHFVTQDWRSSTDPRTALDFTDWAHEMERKTRGVVERPEGPTYMGDCPNGNCEGDLYLKDGHSSMRCGECDTETSVADQQEFIHQKFVERRMTRSEVRAALAKMEFTLDIEVIHKWVQRGKLLPDEHGLFGFAEARALAIEHSQRRRNALQPSA